MSRRLRITLYSLVLALSVIQTAVAFVSGFILGFAHLLLYFGTIAGGFAVVTWVWTSVLLSYNNRPRSTHTLTRTSVHFYSFSSFSVLWLVLGIMVISQAPTNCDFKTPSDGEAGWWCGITVFVGSWAVIISILSGMTALVVKKGSIGLTSHVCSGDGEYRELALESTPRS